MANTLNKRSELEVTLSAARNMLAIAEERQTPSLAWYRDMVAKLEVKAAQTVR